MAEHDAELSPIERLAEHLSARPMPDGSDNIRTQLVADWLDYSLNRCGLVVVPEQKLAASLLDVPTGSAPALQELIMPSEPNELKACPFCGGPATVKEDVDYSTGKPNGRFWVQCDPCDMFPDQCWSKPKDEAIAAWNTRPLPAEPIQEEMVVGALNRVLDKWPHVGFAVSGELRRDLARAAIQALRSTGECDD